jgi:hypothetical protein
MTGPSAVPGNVDFRSSDRPELHRILWLTLGRWKGRDRRGLSIPRLTPGKTTISGHTQPERAARFRERERSGTERR